jgi:hypothetical protein
MRSLHPRPCEGSRVLLGQAIGPSRLTSPGVQPAKERRGIATASWSRGNEGGSVHELHCDFSVSEADRTTPVDRNTP